MYKVYGYDGCVKGVFLLLLVFVLDDLPVVDLADTDSMSENIRLLSTFLTLPFFDFFSLLLLTIKLNTMARKSSIRIKKTLVFFSLPILNCITNKVNKNVSTFAPKKTKNINEIIVLNSS